jgi:3-oxoacyl-[acyl-carrier-protein] synthase-3
MRRCRIESLGASPPRRGLFRWGSVKHAVVAGKRCLAASRYHPADVRVLVNTGVHRDRHTCEPAMAVYVQHGLGINVEFQGRRTLAFDLLNGGCGMLNAMHVVAAMIEAGDAQVAMVVSSEANSDSDPDPAYVWPRSGAGALLDVAPRRGMGFGEFVFHTDESCVDLCTSVVSLAQARGKICVQRKAELEGAWLSRAGGAVAELLAKEKLRKDEIDLVVPAQISAGFLAKLPEAIGFPREKVADLSSDLPDTLSTSVLLALHRAQQKGALGTGKRALLLAFGSGITVAAASHRF